MYDTKYQKRIDAFTTYLFGNVSERPIESPDDLPHHVKTDREPMMPHINQIDEEKK